MSRLAFSFVAGAIVFGVAAALWLRPRERAEGPDTKVLRIAHRQLDPAMRVGFEYVAQRYQQANPGVRIEYLEIPGANFLAWLTTQFVGGTAPDIVEVVVEMSNENVARSFLPLTAMVEQPNPYNRGTPLEAVKWRETFIDGLATAPGYRDAQLDVFGIPTNIVTTRIYYNRALYFAATGRVAPPSTFDEFLEVCREVQAWARRKDQRVFAMGGSNEIHLLLASRAFGQQTQVLALERGDPLGTGRASPPDLLAWLAREPEALRAKPLADSFAILADLGAAMPPGFVNTTRADAVFHFAQGRTVMMVGRSVLQRSLQDQIGFELGTFSLPLPEATHPRFAGNAFGASTEIEQNASAALGITRFAIDPALARDFLQFLSSFRVVEEFAYASRLLPVIVGVDPHPDASVFAPLQSGFPAGLSLTVGDSGHYRALAVARHLHRLYSPQYSVNDFIAGLTPDFNAAARQDLKNAVRSGRRESVRQDILHLAASQFTHGGPEHFHARKRREIEELHAVREFVNAWSEVSTVALADP